MRASNGRPVVVASEMVTMSLDEDDFDRMSLPDLENNAGWISRVKAQSRHQESSTLSRGRLQGSKDTFAFQTRYEQTGLLQVVNVSGNPPGVNIRYKLVQSTNRTRLRRTTALASLPREGTSVSISNLPLEDALLHLAKAQSLNCVIDPRISEDAESDLRHTHVNVNWTNITPAQAFTALLETYRLQINTNAQTGVAQITAAGSVADKLLQERADASGTTSRTLTVVHVADQQVEVEVVSDGNKRLSLYIGDDRWGSGPLAEGKKSLSKLEASDQIGLDDGSVGHGIIWTRIVDGVSSKQFFAITEDGRLPYGEVKIRNAEAISKTTHVLTIADIEKPDGSRVPIFLKLE